VAFATANMHAMRLKERVLRVNELLTGNRLLRGMACLGGVRYDFAAAHRAALVQLLHWLKPEFEALVELIRDSSGTRDRLETTGILKPEVARDFGVVGLAGRASGLRPRSAARFPHAFYDQVQFTVPVFTEGDVQRRLVGDARRSTSRRPSSNRCWQNCRMVRCGRTSASCPRTGLRWAMSRAGAARSSIGSGPRPATGSPGARSRILAPELAGDHRGDSRNIIPDFPVVNKSFNLSYSGTDR